MKCLVTGGAGFIGSHLVDKLIKKRYKVCVIDSLSTGKKENLNKSARFYKRDICDAMISQIFKREKPEVVFHYAAQIDARKSVENPVENAKTNILGSLNILENCRKCGVKKFIFASTGGAIYGEANIVPTPETYLEFPLSPYGNTKLTVEKYLNYYYRVFGLLFVSLRLANVYGPRQNSKGESGVVAIFSDKMLSRKQPIINGNGQQTRDFIFVEDVVEANILAMKKDEVGIFNIGTAKETSVNEIFKRLKNLTNSKYKEIYTPVQPGEQKRSCLDYSKAKNKFGWQPKINLNQGLIKIINWYKSIQKYKR